MVVPILRPLLLVLAGAAVGALVTFGLLNRPAPVQESVAQFEHVPKTLKAREPSPQNQADTDRQPALTADTLDTSGAEEESSSRVQATLKAAKEHVPMKPIPKATMAFQANGLPVGVRPDAGQSDVYKRLPGIQPPLINRDGRDMGPEAIQMLMNRQEVPYPGNVPSASATPIPFPKTVEEANRQSEGYVSPTP
jgi:hypothetical protein